MFSHVWTNQVRKTRTVSNSKKSIIIVQAAKEQHKSQYIQNLWQRTSHNPLKPGDGKRNSS